MTGKDQTERVSDEFDLIVQEHAPWLVQWFSTRLSGEIGLSPDDLAQETLIVLYRNRHRIRDRRKIGPYLRGIAKKILWAEVRNARRKKQVEHSAPTTNALDKTRASQELTEAIRELPQELQLAVLAYYSANVTYDEAADILGIPRSTFQSRLRRALDSLGRVFHPAEDREGRDE